MSWLRAVTVAFTAFGVVHSASPAAADPALVFEVESGRVIYAEDADREWFPASLTKMMTTYLVFEAIEKGDLAPDMLLAVTPRANLQPPTRLGLGTGKTITVELAVRALVMKSANDIAVALAEATAGGVEEFVDRMNETARRLGMMHTRFANPNGLPSENQMTTARDMGLLGRALLRDFPDYAPIFAELELEVGKLKVASHNDLLRTLEGADGMKTGFTCAAGYNIVASATRGRRKIIAVVLGEASGMDRSVRAAKLIEHGFQMFDWKSAFPGPLLETLPYDIQPDVAPDFSRSARMRKCDAPAGIARAPQPHAHAAKVTAAGKEARPAGSKAAMPVAAKQLLAVKVAKPAAARDGKPATTKLRVELAKDRK